MYQNMDLKFEVASVQLVAQVEDNFPPTHWNLGNCFLDAGFHFIAEWWIQKNVDAGFQKCLEMETGVQMVS